jgi:hypothetical protein
MNLWETVWFVCIFTGTVLLFLHIGIFLRYAKEKKRSRSVLSPDLEHTVDLLKYPETALVKPYIPKTFTRLGLACALLVFGCAGYFAYGRTLDFIPMFVVVLCFSFAAEVAGSMIQYATELQIRTDIIFVPKSIGLVGKVIKDIPAAERGKGTVRILMNGVVTQMGAMSVDEVVLTKGTTVKILYAYSDRIVVVERVREMSGGQA